MASTPDNLYVTYVDIDRDLLKIWGQRNRIGATYIERQLLQLLPEFNKTASPNPNRIHKGMFCFAKYTDDNYYRARVISKVQDDSVGVLFVDYGNKDIIKLSNIRVQEGNEGDVLAKMSEQAEEYYLAKVAAPPLGWTKEIVSEIRRDVCYDEFRYQIITHVGDQKILDIQFRDDDFSNYLVKKKLVRQLSIPVQRQLILSYCRLVPNEVKHEELFRDAPRVAFSPSVPPPSATLRMPLKAANVTSDMNMQLNYAKANNTVNFPNPPPALHYPPQRHMKAQFHQVEQSIPKNSYYTPVSQISSQMPVDPVSIQPVNPSMNSLINPQLNQFYQIPENMGHCINNNNSNIIEILAQQVKHYIAKDNAKSEAEAEKTPHHYVNSVLNVGNTYKAVVSFIDDGPWSFSIQLMSSESELKKLMKELASSELIPLKPPIILGHPCIGKRVLDGNLCRGVVVSISTTAVKVYFVDYGNTEDLPSSAIYELPPKFFKTEVLSQKFSLSGLKKVAYSDDIKKFFKEIVEEENLLVRIVSLEDDNLPTCELFVKEINIKRILNEKMKITKVDSLPKVGDTENILVTWVVSPQKFFVQLRKRDSDLKALKEELAGVATKGQKITHKQLCVGLKCVCLYESDGHWYRAVITSIDSEAAITVFYVDYGNTETVNLSLLRIVEGSILINQMANQAIQCCLKGFENQPFDEQLTSKLESLTLENEFQMSVESSEKQLLCVNLYDNGNDIASLLLLTQSQMLAQTHTHTQLKETNHEAFNQSEGSFWGSPESVKPAFPNKTESEKKFQVNEFLEKKERNFRGDQNRRKSQGPRSGQNFKHFQSPIRATHAHLKSRYEERENWREENAFCHEKDNNWGFDQQKNWRSRGPKEFGDWDSSKFVINKGLSTGWEESNDSAERGGGFNQSRNRNARDDRRVNNYGDKKFCDNRGRRFDGDKKFDDNDGRRFESNRERDSSRTDSEDSRKRFSEKSHKFGDRDEKLGGRNEKLEEKKSSRVLIKREDVAPAGLKFEERIINIGSTERGIVTYYFSPDEFFVQLLAQEEDFKKMMRDIQRYYSDKYPIRDPVKAGDIVIAQFSYDKILYRAEVIKPSPVTVRYVDYGNREPVQQKGTWLVDKEFLRLPQQVVKCRLSGLQPVGSDWPPPGSSVDKFFEFVEYKCTFLKKEGDMYEISMEAVENGKDIASEIIASGLGRPLSPKLEIPETDYSLLRNQILRLYVSHVDSSSKFYVIVNPKASELIAEAISNIDDDKMSLSLIDWSSLQPNMPCLANTNGSSWCRGNIKKTDGNSAVVWLSDTGDSVELPKDKVKRLPDYLKYFQPQAVQCCLHGISSLDDEESFKKAVEYKNYLVHILSVTDKRLSVILYDDDGHILDFEKDSDSIRLIEPIAQLPIITQKIPLIISHLESPKEVYIQRTSDEDSLTNFLEQVTNFYAEEGEQIPEEGITAGALVAARSKIYESWYRGRIMSSSAEKLEVFYIDYGNKEVLPRENFKKLDSSFMGMNAFCRRLSFGVNFDQRKIKEINSKIWELCDDGDLLGYFKNSNGELILEIKANEKNVTESLKLSGLISVDESNRFVGTESGATHSQKTFEQQSDASEYRVFVSHIDCPSRFWVHKEALINELQQFQDRLHRSCEFLPCKKDVMLGDVVAAVFSGLWYRAKVIKVEGNSVTVQFIDYGNTSQVDLDSEVVMELTSDLLDVPVFATHCALKGTWSENYTSKFEDIILRSEDPVRLVTLEKGNPIVVDLFQNERSIAEMLLDECIESDAEEVEDSCTVYITHCISPLEFYVQRESCTAALNELSERLADAQNFEDPPSVEKNELYAAKYPEDGAWYRARVSGKIGDDITVHFVDYGNTSTITKIKTLPSDLREIPNLSEKCALVYGNNCDSWSDAACNLFAEYADGRALQMKVIARGAKRAIVKIYYEEKDISEELEALCENDGRDDMYVSHAVSPTDFYIQYVDDEQYKMIAETLSGEGDHENLADRTEGTICQARFIEDGYWYRARILQDLGDEGCKVFFIDFGNTSTSKELKKLPKEIEDIPPRALKCSLDLKNTIMTENMREDFINLTAAGAAVFRGRIISPGKTNIITLKLDGRIVEETLNVDVITEEDEKNLKCDAEDDTKTDDEENDIDKQRGEQSSEADRSTKDVSFEKVATEETSEKTEPKESGNQNGISSGFDDSSTKVNSRTKVHKIVPVSISRGDREESVSKSVKASYKKLKFSEKLVPGSISRGVSLHSVTEEVAAERDVEKKPTSQSAPNTPRPLRKSDNVKVDVKDRLVPGCISTGIPSEKITRSEKVDPGAVNGSVDN